MSDKTSGTALFGYIMISDSGSAGFHIPDSFGCSAPKESEIEPAAFDPVFVSLS